MTDNDQILKRVEEVLERLAELRLDVAVITQVNSEQNRRIEKLEGFPGKALAVTSTIIALIVGVFTVWSRVSS